MKKVGMLSLLVLMALSTSFAHARTIEQEIDDEAKIGMSSAGTAGTSFNRVAKPKAVAAGSLFQLVPIGGMTFTNFKGASGNYSFSTTSGYDAGVGILIGRGDLQFETGVMYAERGSKETYRLNASTWSIGYQNKYIELPLMARYNVVNNRDFRIYLKGGALMAVLQDSQGTMSNVQNYTSAYNGINYYGANTFNSSLLVDNNTKSAFAPTDLRWALGTGGQVRLTNALAWTLEVDYQTSTGNISTSQPDGYYGSSAMNLTMETYGVRTGLVFSL